MGTTAVKKPQPPDANRIRRITESIIGLPTLPVVVTKMIDLVDSPRTSAVVLARLIGADQSLTARSSSSRTPPTTASRAKYPRSTWPSWCSGSTR